MLKKKWDDAIERNGKKQVILNRNATVSLGLNGKERKVNQTREQNTAVTRMASVESLRWEKLW